MFGTSNSHRLIVGVDYGTTYSGVSYTTTANKEKSLENVNVIQSWPGSLGSRSGVWKAPSCIAYKRENPRCLNDKWGYEVTPAMKSYAWTKLLLDRHAKPTVFDDPTLTSALGDGVMKVPTHPSIEGVVEDYLRLLYNYTVAKFKRELSVEVFDRTPMDCWITMPSIWSDKAQKATHDAAKKAGWASRLQDRIFMITEPEAAAIATLADCIGDKALDPLQPAEVILVCDCGGGTVDITTYQIIHTKPQLAFKELCVGAGGKCGSTYIDRNFHTLMSTRFGAAFTSLDVKVRGPGSRLMRSFEDIKCGFGETENLEKREIEPFVMDVESSDNYDAETSTIFLSHHDLQALFDPVMKDVVRLVAEQADQVKSRKDESISRIILVGGFGSSPALFTAVKTWCTSHGDIRLMCPPHPQAAVVRGAALYGLQGIVPSSRRCRRHYGYSVTQYFRTGIDPESKAHYNDWDDLKCCSDRMSWLIAHGEEISKTIRGTGVQSFLFRGEEEAVSTIIGLYSCNSLKAPEYSDCIDVDCVGLIRMDLSSVDRTTCESRYHGKGGKTVYRLNYEILVKFGEDKGLLEFSAILDGNILGTAEIEYDRH